MIRSTRSALVGGQKMRSPRMSPSRLIGGQIALDGLLQEYRSSKRQKNFSGNSGPMTCIRVTSNFSATVAMHGGLIIMLRPKLIGDREKKRKRKSGDDDELNIPADYSAWSVFMAV